MKYENGELDKESAELFLTKIGGVLVVKNLPPVKQKLAYIKKKVDGAKKVSRSCHNLSKVTEYETE